MRVPHPFFAFFAKKGGRQDCPKAQFVEGHNFSRAVKQQKKDSGTANPDKNHPARSLLFQSLRRRVNHLLNHVIPSAVEGPCVVELPGAPRLAPFKTWDSTPPASSVSFSPFQSIRSIFQYGRPPLKRTARLTKKYGVF
jgi:hypothetical protein